MRIIKHFGPPGTGKTTKLMGLVNLEVRAGTPLEKIAYLSFSKAACEVIKERMNATKDQARWFRTLHGACVKSLGIADAIMDWRDYEKFSRATGMKVTTDEMEDRWDNTKPTDFNPVLRAYQLHLTTLRPLKDIIRELPDHPNLNVARVNHFIETWEKWKRDNHRFDFIDMLVEYDRNGTPLPIDVAFLDESQDLTALQWRVFHKMVANARIVHMAGDDDQSIYGFLGASEYGFLEHPCDEEHVISKSWRVPQQIGAFADKVIGHVPHRKEKRVEWKQEPGGVARLNLDAMSMPWRKWRDEYCQPDQTGIMVLTRHRSGATAFSNDLKLAGVPHSLNGETMNTWPEARILHSLYSLKAGKTITSLAARKLAEALGKDSRGFREMGPRVRVGEIPGVDLRSLDWLAQFSTTRRARARYISLLALVKRDGYESLAADPKIVVGTMHGSKGKEAELVIIVPDCTSIVKQNSMTPTEIRLSYVALTRAKRHVSILMPRTDMYIHHFFGG